MAASASRRRGALWARALWKVIPESLRRPVRPWLMPRRFQAFCVGTPRSGTHSVAAVFGPAYRSGHERGDGLLRRAVHGLLDGGLGEDERRRLLLERDRELYLELDSANLLGLAIKDLVALFPEARFILTVRHCLSWLESQADNHVNWPKAGSAGIVRQARYGSLWGHPPQEAAFARAGVFTVDGYLRGWTAHNQGVLSAVPPARLLVVRTHEIGERLEDMARFVGAEPGALDASRAHEDRRRAAHGLAASLPRPYLEETLRRNCGELMERFFPGVPLLEPPAATRRGLPSG